jgi:AcrR family transcriptional regulator
MKPERILSTPPAVGAAVLRSDHTKALLRSALIELARFGYARLSMGAVARRAGVGKPALYRRWKGKEELVIDLLEQVSIPIITVEDRGSLFEELREYVRRGIPLLQRPLSRRILPDLYSEMSRDTLLGSAIRDNFQEPKRKHVSEIIKRAIARGEISNAVDLNLALDLIAGPLYWRFIVTQDAIDDRYADRFAHMLVGALHGAVADIRLDPKRRR